MLSSEELLTEVLEPGDPRGEEERFQETNHVEVEGLKKRGTKTVIDKSTLPSSANIHGGRFVLALKDVRKKG